MIKERKEKEEWCNLIFIAIFYLQILPFVPNLCVNGIILSLAKFTTLAAKYWDLGHQLKPQYSLVLVNSGKLNTRLVVLTNIYEAYRMCIQESFCQRMGLVTLSSTANTEILFPLPCFISLFNYNRRTILTMFL